MKQGVLRNHSDIHIETDNTDAFNLVMEQDEDILEVEDLMIAVQQINILHAEYNMVFEDESQPRSCRITFVFATRNVAPMFLAEYGITHCDSLVEVPVPFGRFAEILDLDNGLGPH